MTSRTLSVPRKASLVLRSWYWFAVSWTRLRRGTVPQVVTQLGRVTGRPDDAIPPIRLGRIVTRSLAIGPFRARCLFTSLVLFRLLRSQGDLPELVIGLPTEPRDKDAHAWIELDGRDVGPPPGRGGHQELARYR